MGVRTAVGDRGDGLVLPSAAHGRALQRRRRGAWYAAFALRTAHAEALFHRTAELEEIGGWFDTFVQMADYLADFRAVFHDLREPRFARYLNPHSYERSQRLAGQLLEQGSNGIVYPSIRDRSGTCVASFRPALVTNVRLGGFYEYRWSGTREATIRRLENAATSAE